METSIALPDPLPDDPEVVATALETASIFGVQGDAREAVRWVRRAAELAGDAGADDRAFALARAAADLVANLQPTPVAPAPAAAAPAPMIQASAVPAAPPSAPPPAAIPAQPPFAVAAPALPEGNVTASSPPPPPPPPPVIPGPARGSNRPAASEQSVSVSPIVALGTSTPNFSGNTTLPLHGAPQAVAAPVVAPQAFAPQAFAAPVATAPSVAPQAVAAPVVAPPQAVAPQAVAPQAVAPQAVAAAVNGSGINGNGAGGAATAESTGSFQRLARAYHDGADVQPAPAPPPPLPPAVYEPVPVQPTFSDVPAFAASDLAQATAPLDVLLRDAARTAARASIEASQEDGVYIVRLLKSEEGAPEGAHEALVVLVDPNSDLFDTN